MKPHELPKHGDIRPGVYRIVHVASGKFYVGSARNIYARIMNHTSNLRRGLHHVKELQRLFTLDERLEWIFERCEDRAHAYAREQEELNLAFLHEPEKVLNIAKDAMAPKRVLPGLPRLRYGRRCGSRTSAVFAQAMLSPVK